MGTEIIRRSHDFWRAYSLFVARVASFAPEGSEGANDADVTKIRKTRAIQALRAILVPSFRAALKL